MNWEQIKGRWNQTKGFFKKRWGKLSDNDVAVNQKFKIKTELIKGGVHPSPLPNQE